MSEPVLAAFLTLVVILLLFLAWTPEAVEGVKSTYPMIFPQDERILP